MAAPEWTKRTTPIDWATVEWPLPSMLVMCFDQSLVNSGFVLLDFSGSRPPIPLATGTSRTKPTGTLKGFADSFARGEILYTAFRNMLSDYRPDVVMHEMPAITGKVVTRNREAATVAVMALRCAAISVGLGNRIGMAQSQHVKKIITGNGNAKKPFVRQCLEGSVQIGKMNEHVADALAVGLASAIDGTLTRILEVPLEDQAAGRA